jgi:hypothetical protein
MFHDGHFFPRANKHNPTDGANMGILKGITGFFIKIFVLFWDLALFILNFFTPSRKAGRIIPPHAPGHGLTWPAYIPPKDSDSRSACPMLNALANHGIL